MKALADYVHSKGLKFGIYTDIAEKTCAGAEGTYGYEVIDAHTYAEWGVDYIKCDYCGAPKDLMSAIERYGKFGRALKATGRELIYAVCEWGRRSPWLWGADVGGHLWRTTWDLRDVWEHGRYNSGHAGIMEVLDRQVGPAGFAGPGRWNDPDMLIVRLYGKGKSASVNGADGCSDREYRSQMSLWCLLSAPLLVCCDIRELNDDSKEILLNPEVIAVNQDPGGKQADRIFKQGVIEIWGKELKDGSWAVGLLNRDDESPREITLDFKMIGSHGKHQIRDLWERKDLGVFADHYSTKVLPHQVLLFKISAIK